MTAGEKWQEWEEGILASGRAAQDRAWEAERQQREEDARLRYQLELKRRWQQDQDAAAGMWWGERVAWIGYAAIVVGLCWWMIWGK